MFLKKEKNLLQYNLLKKNRVTPQFNLAVGDFICLGIKLFEQKKIKIQEYTGLIIAKKNISQNSTIILRCICQTIILEYCFLLNSPHILFIKILYSIKIKSSKLYYLRKLNKIKYKNLNSNI